MEFQGTSFDMNDKTEFSNLMVKLIEVLLTERFASMLKQHRNCIDPIKFQEFGGTTKRNDEKSLNENAAQFLPQL
jgi:hypothetical protein